MSWAEVFVAFFVCHLTGDFLLQTDWQATHKRGGLGGNRVARSALLAHVLTYTLAFVPALVWLAREIEIPLVAALAAIIAVPHLIQDDGRLLEMYTAKVKGLDAATNPPIAAAVDQSLHLVALFLVAVAASA